MIPLTFDQDVLDVDLPLLKGKFDPAQLEIQLQRAFRTVEAYPATGKELDYQLAGYRSYKFHSRLRPAPGDKADLRLVYRIEPEEIHVLALRERPDVYSVAVKRLVLENQAP